MWEQWLCRVVKWQSTAACNMALCRFIQWCACKIEIICGSKAEIKYTCISAWTKLSPQNHNHLHEITTKWLQPQSTASNTNKPKAVRRSCSVAIHNRVNIICNCNKTQPSSQAQKEACHKCHKARNGKKFHHFCFCLPFSLLAAA